MFDGYLTMTELAQRWGVTRPRITQMLQEGKLKGHRRGVHIWLALDDIAELERRWTPPAQRRKAAERAEAVP